MDPVITLHSITTPHGESQFPISNKSILYLACVANGEREPCSALQTGRQTISVALRAKGCHHIGYYVRSCVVRSCAGFRVGQSGFTVGHSPASGAMSTASIM